MHIHLLLALVLAVCVLPVLAFAGDATPSYSMRKQGRVPFSAEQTAAAESDQADDSQPSEIEPAAGAEDEAAAREPSESPSLQDNMRLPRKN